MNEIAIQLNKACNVSKRFAKQLNDTIHATLGEANPDVAEEVATRYLRSAALQTMEELADILLALSN